MSYYDRLAHDVLFMLSEPDTSVLPQETAADQIDQGADEVYGPHASPGLRMEQQYRAAIARIVEGTPKGQLLEEARRAAEIVRVLDELNERLAVSKRDAAVRQGVQVVLDVTAERLLEDREAKP